MKKLLQYQLHTTKRSLLIFYSILIVCILIFSGSAAIILNGEVKGSSSFSGIEFATIIFLFVCGLVSFSETFHMFLQNGITRKRMLASLFLYSTILCAITSLIDKLILILGSFMETRIEGLSFTSLFAMVFPDFIQHQNPVFLLLINFLLGFTLYMSFMFFGLFLSIASYRGSRIVRILIAAGLPVFLFVVTPILDTILDGKLYSFLNKVLQIFSGFKSQNPFIGMASFLIISAFWGTLAYVLGRKACKQQ